MHTITMKPGSYIFADPCHVIPSNHWGSVIDQTNCFDSNDSPDFFIEDPRISYRVDGFLLLSASTAHGDGEYQSTCGRYSVGVDAGMIGAVNIEHYTMLVTKDKGASSWWEAEHKMTPQETRHHLSLMGKVLTFTEPWQFAANDEGLIRALVNDKVVLEFDTAGQEGMEDDEEDYDHRQYP